MRRPGTVALGAVLLLATTACSTNVGSSDAAGTPGASAVAVATASPAIADACLVLTAGAPATALASELVDAGLTVRLLPVGATAAGTDLDIPPSACAAVLSVDPDQTAVMERAARSHPDLPFAAVGVGGPPGAIANLATLRTDPRDAAFLAGYLAAALSRSGQIGAIGLRSDRAAESTIQSFASGAALAAAHSGVPVRVRGGGPARLLGDDESPAPVLARWADRGVDVLFLASSGLPAAPDPRMAQIVMGQASGVASGTGAGTGGRVVARIVPDLTVPARVVARQVSDGVFVGGDVAGSLADGGVRLEVGEVPAGVADALAAARAEIDAGRRDATGSS